LDYTAVLQLVFFHSAFFGNFFYLIFQVSN